MKRYKYETRDDLKVLCTILLIVLGYLLVLWCAIHVGIWIWGKPDSKPAPVVNTSAQYGSTRYQLAGLYDEPSAATKPINTIKTITHDTTTQTPAIPTTILRTSCSLCDPYW